MLYSSVGRITYIVLVQTLNHAQSINQSMLYTCTHTCMATVGVKGLITRSVRLVVLAMFSLRTVYITAQARLP